MFSLQEPADCQSLTITFRISIIICLYQCDTYPTVVSETNEQTSQLHGRGTRSLWRIPCLIWARLQTRKRRSGFEVSLQAVRESEIQRLNVAWHCARFVPPP